jgi:hypothetical protein
MLCNYIFNLYVTVVIDYNQIAFFCLHHILNNVFLVHEMID